ncbi:hypothetical protein ACFQ77_16430 [Streptomyces virginiae]|uniref:hypothetical protein n=2 Tax=Streptomyces virginiae TaxID=1961 RepID=UPI00368BEC19
MRETAAQVRVEEFREEARRVPAELAEVEAVLEPEADSPPKSATANAEAPVAGSVVPHRRVDLTWEVLAPDYQRLVGVLDAEAEAGGSGLRARELAVQLGLEAARAKAEGLRSKGKRLVERGRPADERPGVFTPRRAAGRRFGSGGGRGGVP